MPTDDDKFTEEQLDALLRVIFSGEHQSKANKDSDQSDALDAGEPLDLDLEVEIVSLLEKGRKNKAIKLYRKQSGASLKEASEIVQDIATDNDISPKKAGCAGMILLIVMVFTILGIGVWVLPA